MRRFVHVIITLFAAALLATGWYVYNKGFTKKWRTFVSDEFRKRGVELTLRKLTVDPLRGIVAQEVKVFDSGDRKRTLAVIDDMRLVINWANLVRGKTFLDALDLRDARLSLPIDPKDARGPKIDITRLSGRLMLPPEQVYLSNLEAELYGIRVTASGRLVNPQYATIALRKRNQTAKGSAETFAKVIDELRALKMEGEAPMLDVRFSGDLARPETVFVEAKLSAEKVRRGNWLLEALYVDALYRDERLAIRQLTLGDGKGELRLSGSYDPQAKGLELQLHSSLDPQLLVSAFARVQQLEEFVFYQPPALDLTVRAAFGDSPELQASGHLSAERFGLRSVIFESFDADLVLDGERWAARNLNLVHRSGKMSGDIMRLPGDFRSRLKSTLDPKTLSPLLGSAVSDWLKQFDFTDPPDIHVEARGSEPNAKSLWANGALRLGRTSYKGVAAQSATATIRYADRRLTIDPLRVVRPEGFGGGGLVFDFARDEVEVHDIRTSLHPQEVIPWVSEKLAPDIEPYRFGKRTPPLLVLDGVVHTKGGDTTQLRLDVDAPGGMDYTFMRRDLHFPKIGGKLSFVGPRLKIDSLNGALFGGKLRGTLDISLKKEAPGHQAEIWIENVDFPALTKLFFKYDTSKGRLNAHYAFSGKGNDSRTMRGRGQLSVTDGQVFAIPFLGPLSGILNTIVPGMGDDEARKGGASFVVDSGVISTSDFLVEGTGFSMIGGGKLFYLDDKMDFDVRINARGLPGVLLFPVSKLLEYTSTDALSKPNWRPKIVPRFQ